MASVLLILGGLAQIVGVIMVIVSLRSTLDQLARYEHRPRTVYGAGAVAISTAFGATVVTTQRPSLEDRVTGVEERVRALGGEITEATEKLRRELHNEIERSRDIVMKSYRDDFDALSAFTTQTLRDQRWPTLIGAALLIVGLIVVTIGSVMA